MTATKTQHEVPKEEQIIDMQLTSKNGDTKQRKLANYTMKTPTGESKTILKFTDPGDIRDVGLLTWENAGDAEDDQWLYLPASKQVKRIVSGAKKNKFMNTDFSFEDLRPENLTAHTYTFLRDDTLDGQAVSVLEAKPSEKEAAESAYSKRVIFIRKDINFILRAEYFDKRDRHEKTMINTEIAAVQGEIYRAKKCVMKDEVRGTSTLMEVTGRSFAPEWDEALFTERNLQRRSN